jgi:pyruvate dehydrogenase E2 component (dihydrolipoamide acetyltransferase)
MGDAKVSIPIVLPSFGASVEEGTVIRWLVSVGDPVRAGQVIAEIETDKAMVELEVTEDGVIEAIEVPEGDNPVRVGTAIARLTRDGSVRDLPARPGQSAEKREPAPAAETDAPPLTPRPGHREANRSEEPRADRHQDQATSDDSPPRRVLASPRARRLARERGRSLDELPGSGPRGRIVGADLEAPPARNMQSAVSPTLTANGIEPGSYEIMPLSGMRRTIARRMTESSRDVPRFSLSLDVEMDSVIQRRHTHNETHAAGSTNLSINDFVIWATAAALKEVPEANASFTEEGIARHRHANIAVAVAIDGGLVTPVLRAAETKSVQEIAAAMRQLRERARTRRLEKHEMEGGTITVSNLGMAGITSFTSVLNPPQGCILSVGSAGPRPIVRDGQLAIATLMTVTLTCDHRVVDGVIGARFLSAFRRHLETPDSKSAV